MKFRVVVYEPDIVPGGYVLERVIEAASATIAENAVLTEAKNKWPEGNFAVYETVPEEER